MKSGATRQHYVDWLRVIATIGIFLFHNSRPYDDGDWHVKNAQLSPGATQFVEFMNIWMMPLFFVLSGAAVYYSLRSRNGGSFLKERFFRIMVPWFITGIFVMSPPQVYLERLSHGEFDGSFFQFLPHYFDGLYTSGGNFAWMGLHTWYLMMLSVFSVVLLPLLWVPVGVVALLSSAIGLGFTEQMGSWDILSYAMFFTLGYMLFASPGLQESIRKQGGWFLLAAVAFSALHMVLKFSVRPAFYEDIDFRLLATWGWIVGLLWIGGRMLNFTNRFLAHVNEMVLPFYILHQTVIVIIAYFVVRTSLAIPFKYGITAVTSFLVIVILYELLVSRIGVLRFLFGMRGKAAASKPRRAAASVT